MIKNKIKNTYKICLIIAITLISIIPFTMVFSKDVDDTLQSVTLRQSYVVELDPDEYLIHSIGYVSFSDHVSYYCMSSSYEPISIRAVRAAYISVYPTFPNYETITSYLVTPVIQGNWYPRVPNEYYYFVYINEGYSQITLYYSTSVISDLPFIATIMGISLGIIGAVATVITLAITLPTRKKRQIKKSKL
ncbi:MAG: hypothetical protein ACFFBP_02690 [Promethearchaeota archaeon]